MAHGIQPAPFGAVGEESLRLAALTAENAALRATLYQVADAQARMMLAGIERWLELADSGDGADARTSKLLLTNLTAAIRKAQETASPVHVARAMPREVFP